MKKLILIVGTLVMTLFALSAWAGDIVTVAGHGLGDGGQAIASTVYNPTGVTVDSSGNIYIADSDNNVIRKVDASTGVITTVAGYACYGSGRYSGDGYLATSTAVQLNHPTGVAVDSSGNIYIADSDNNVIRKVDASTGVITTLVGNGIYPNIGLGNFLPTYVALNHPTGVAVDSSGNLYIADRDNNVIRKFDASAGVIRNVAGNGIGGFSGDIGPATSASLNHPTGVAVDSSGHIYIADSDNNRIRKVSPASGNIVTYAGSGVVGGFSGDMGQATSASLNHPTGVAVDSSGHIYIADSDNNRIRKVDASVIATVAGDGSGGYSGDNGLAISASLNHPRGVAVDSSGGIYIADSNNNRIRNVDASTGVIATVAGDGSGGYSGDNGLAISASLNHPRGVAVDSSGNIFIADIDNNVIRKVDALTGVITTIAGTGIYGYSGDNGLAISASLHDPTGIAVDSSGNIYMADRGNRRIRKVDATTGVITTVAISENNPLGIAVDSSGNIYIAASNTIQKVDASTGVITTVAGYGLAGYSGDGGSAISAQLNYPTGVAVDSSGNIYIADRNNWRIRKVDASTGVITTVAGNGSVGYLFYPSGVSLDSSGNIYIADTSNNSIRKVDASTGVITTVAGYGFAGYSGDGGSAISASLNNPYGVAVDASGNIYIADTSNNSIRKVIADITTTTLQINAPSVTYGVNGSVTVSVSSIDSAPTGSVTLYVDGGSAIKQSLSPIGGSNPPAASAVFTITKPITGNHTLSASYAAQGDFAASSASNTLTVNTRTLTVTATVTDRVYNGTANAVASFSDDRLPGDLFTVFGTAEFNNKNVGTGKAVSIAGLYLSGVDAGNYNLTSNTASATASITTAMVLPNVTVSDKIYDGNTSATITTRTLTGVMGSDDVTLTGGSATFADAGIGTNKLVSVTGLTLAGTSAGNYQLNSTAVVTQANIYAALPGMPTEVSAMPGNGQATVTFAAPVSDGGSAIMSYTVTASPGGNTASGASSPIMVTGLINGTGYTFTVTATNPIGTGPASIPSRSVTPFANNTYSFSGFFSPVDNLPTVNVAKAGQTIPVKWQMSDGNGLTIADPASFKSLTSYGVSCDSLSGGPTSEVDDYSAGSSGLQYLGNGYWQFNWKTPKTYAGQCGTMVLTLGDGTTHTASFKFNK